MCHLTLKRPCALGRLIMNESCRTNLLPLKHCCIEVFIVLSNKEISGKCILPAGNQRYSLLIIRSLELTKLSDLKKNKPKMAYSRDAFPRD